VAAAAALLLLMPANEALSSGRPTCAAWRGPRGLPPRRRASRLLAEGGSQSGLGSSSGNDPQRGNGFGEQSVVDALAALRRGEMIIVTDDEARENEGDLIMAAEHATAQAMAFMVRHTSGVLCVGMESERIDELRLPQMVGSNEDPKGTAFTVSVDARTGTSTGISAADRAETLRQIADPSSCADDFQRPGHIFPLRARKHGVLARQGHTEAAVDLCRLAGLQPAGVLCEIVSADGLSMARMPELVQFGAEHKLVMTTITDLVSGRWAGC
jgi:3,4-dihydroxy 2-butanone 4-phosphate synthase/GTP cyclohydrolase II